MNFKKSLKMIAKRFIPSILNPQSSILIQKASGFTLIELIIVIVIIGVLSTVTAPMIYQAMNAYNQHSNLGDVYDQSRVTFNRLMRELRMIRSRSASDLVIGSNQITFVSMNGETTTYSLSGSSLLRNGTVISDNVSSFSLTYQDSTGATTSTNAAIQYVTVAITWTKGSMSTTLRGTVYVRN